MGKASEIGRGRADADGRQLVRALAIEMGWLTQRADDIPDFMNAVETSRIDGSRAAKL